MIRIRRAGEEEIHTQKNQENTDVFVCWCVSAVSLEQEVQTKHIYLIIEPKKKEKAKRSQCSGKLGS